MKKHSNFSKLAMASLIASFFVGVIAQGGTDSKTRTCKFAYLFGAMGTDVTRDRTTRQFCSTVSKTCCTEQDFQQMQSWWENSFDKISVVEQRLIEMRTLLGRFNKLSNYLPEVQVRVERVKNYKLTGQPACVTPAHIFGIILELGLVKTAIKSYQESSKTCWSHSKSLVNGLMCSVCDAEVQDMFQTDSRSQIVDGKSQDVQFNRVLISNQECLAFSNACLLHVKSMWAITHYITFMNMMTKCNEKAEFNGSHESIILEDSELRAINSCLHAKNTDDCAQVCRRQLSFSTKLKFEHESVEKVMRFLKNIDNEFGSIAREARIQREKNSPYVPPSDQENIPSSSSSTSASPAKSRLLEEEHGHLIGENEDETKRKILEHYGFEEDKISNSRLLQGGPTPPTPEQEREQNKSRTTQLDSIDIRVRENGINFSKYTENGADSYEQMNLDLIFPKQTLINAVSMVGMLLLSILTLN